jgi:hypothetical protein
MLQGKYQNERIRKRFEEESTNRIDNTPFGLQNRTSFQVIIKLKMFAISLSQMHATSALP